MKSARGSLPSVVNRPAVRLSDKSTAPYSYSAVCSSPRTVDSRRVVAAASSPRSLLLSCTPFQGADLWRRSSWTRFSFPAACRLYATMRHFHSGLSRCLLNDALRDLADVSQAAGSCLIAPACHEQNDTGATHELGKVIQELGFFSQGQSHG